MLYALVVVIEVTPFEPHRCFASNPIIRAKNDKCESLGTTCTLGHANWTRFAWAQGLAVFLQQSGRHKERREE